MSDFCSLGVGACCMHHVFLVCCVCVRAAAVCFPLELQWKQRMYSRVLAFVPVH